MTQTLEFRTRGGAKWVPQYILSIDPEDCIGCGRCFKVCPQAVLDLKGVTDDGELVDAFDEDAEIVRKVMTIKAEADCIGCSACAKVCGANCQTHGPLPA